MADIGKSCLSAAAKTSWYTPGALNVYYVAAVEKPAGGAYAGWYCGSLETLPAVRDPHVIYISFPQRNFTMLSHEVGHALGLLHTGAGTTAQTFDPASATPKPFTNANLMWDMFAAPRAAVLGNYRQQYRSRAAYALGRIKGSAAVSALDSALADSSNTGSLRTDIQDARALAGGP